MSEGKFISKKQTGEGSVEGSYNAQGKFEVNV